MLTEDQAVEIYKLKLLLHAVAQSNKDESRPTEILLRRESEILAKRYGLTIRAIRDIWNRRSWAYATHHLWTQELDHQVQCRLSSVSAAQPMHFKRPGRPLGAKDRRPRVKVSQSPVQEEVPCMSPMSQRGDFSASECVCIQDCFTDRCGPPSIVAWVEVVSEPWERSNSTDEVDPFHDDWAHW